MFYMYHNHNILPDEFASKNLITQRLLIAFTEIEVELDNKKAKEYEKLAKKNR